MDKSCRRSNILIWQPINSKLRETLALTNVESTRSKMLELKLFCVYETQLYCRSRNVTEFGYAVPPLELHDVAHYFLYSLYTSLGNHLDTAEQSNCN